MSMRANQLADRIENGANQLAAFAEKLSQKEWQTICPSEKRPVGVLIYHVASSYPVEVDLIQALASGDPIKGVTRDMVDQMNFEHANAQAKRSKTETITLLKENSSLAADAVRSLSDEQLDNAAPISLNWDAPLTTQYFIEEHPISHSYAHLASIRAVISNTF